MRKFISLLLCMLMVISAIPFVAASAEAETEFDGIIEINSWEEFEAAFENLPKYSYESYKMVLMKDLSMSAGSVNRSATSMISVSILGNNVEFDFNGHTLYGEDNVSDSDTDAMLSDFITVYVSGTHSRGVTLRLTDSVGGGGVKMFSRRAHDSQLAAIRVSATNKYEIRVWQSNGDLTYLPQSTNKNLNTLIIDGGNYVLEAESEKFSVGTLGYNCYYRGAFIAHHINTVINNGFFEAMGSGWYSDYADTDMCARELSAFGTTRYNMQLEMGSVVINGGAFKSNGYALHHFDHGNFNIDECCGDQLIPSVHGGIFAGRLGFVGHTFTYSDGNEEMNELPATNIVKTSSALFMKQNGNIVDIEEATFEDLHNGKSLIVLSEDIIGFETNPTADGEETNLSYPINLSENFSVKYSISDFLNKYVNFTELKPYITTKGTNDTEWNTEYADNKTISFADYPDGLELILGVELHLGKYMLSFSKKFNISVTEATAPANIITQPESIKVGIGELGSAVIEAENVAAYQWQIELSGGGWISITDDIAATLMENGKIHLAGYQSRAFFIVSDVLSTAKVRCVLTGTDGSTTTSRTVTVTFGDIPQVENFYSYGYYADGDAVFYLWGDYFERVSWKVVFRGGSTFNIYSLDEFKEKTGVEYDTSLKLFGGVYRAVVTFKNVPESISRGYSVGYSVENVVGKVNFSPDNVVPFELLLDAPLVNECIAEDNCFEGESLEYSFSSADMISAEWRFETVDEDGIYLAYDIEEMESMFEGCEFVTAFEDGRATLTINNASLELNKYTLHAYAVGGSANSYAGSAWLSVNEMPESDPEISDEETSEDISGDSSGEEASILLGDVNGDGTINSLDAAQTLKHDAQLITLEGDGLAAADVNGDGTVNSLDAAQILKFDAKLITEF